MTQIAIATCEKFPALTPSDQLLADALSARGARVIAAPWNGDFAPFAEAALTVVRSTWDYFDVTAEFDAWIARLENESRVLNPSDVLRWSMTKAYLFELAKQDAPTPPMQLVAPTADAIAGAMDALAVEDAIVKPLSGGTASGLSRLMRRDGALSRKALEQAAAQLNGDALVMPFLPEIETLGETSFVFLGGEFSHAVVKTPKAGDIRVQAEHGGAVRPVSPPVWAIAEATRILSMCPSGAAYARVDVIVHDDRLSLMEVELVEPELFFTLQPAGADRLAEILLDSVQPSNA